MSFHEKTNLAMLVILAIVFGGYFYTVAGHLLSDAPPPALDAVWGSLLRMVLLLVALMVAFHITATVFAPKDSEQPDERDRSIEIRAEARSGVVLGIGIVWALILLFADIEPYWIAHALMFTLVASEIAKSVLRAIAYRVG
ncbi:hypothetical protein [Glycocaulis sp.]|uniref:hypothetical protein n=1 Tax=Glycocaulis sp. TaxID=1969725 RepID=UPI003D21ABA4